MMSLDEQQADNAPRPAPPRFWWTKRVAGAWLVLLVALTCLHAGWGYCAQAQLQAKREEISEEETELVAELGVQQEREVLAQKALAKAQAEVDRIELALRRLDQAVDSRQLAEFIQERVSSEDYRKHLGIISVIRKDLEFLNCKLNPTEECKKKGIIPDVPGEGALPRIDRIVLYVDDLDRCPENRVVQVLQAVHLVLAFELFVVVVGVDSRWLLRSLEQTYPTLQVNASKRAGWSEEEVLAWQSTPQNYLEKIFQIPYALPPMGRDGFQNLVSKILSPAPSVSLDEDADVEPPVEQEAEDASQVKPEEGEPTAEEVVEQIPTLQAEPVQPLESVLAPIVVEALPDEEEELPIDLTPKTLTIDEDERLFISQLAALIPTPRAAKRFINIY